MKLVHFTACVLTVSAVTWAAPRSVAEIEADISKTDAAIKDLGTRLQDHKDWCRRWRVIKNGVTSLNDLADTYAKTLKKYEDDRQRALNEFKTQYRVSVWEGWDTDHHIRDALALLHARNVMGEEPRDIWDYFQRDTAAIMIERGPSLKTDTFDTAAKKLKAAHAAYCGKVTEIDHEIEDNANIPLWGDGLPRRSLAALLDLRKKMNARLDGKRKRLNECPETTGAMTDELDALWKKRERLLAEKHAAQFPVTLRVIRPTVAELAKPYELAPPTRLTLYQIHLEVEVTNLPPGLHRLEAAFGDAGDRYLWARVKPGETVARFVGRVPVPRGPFRLTLDLADRPTGTPKVLEGTMKRSSLTPGRKWLDRQVELLEKHKAAADADLKKPPSERGTAIAELACRIYFLAAAFHTFGHHKTALGLCQNQTTWYKRLGKADSFAQGGNCYRLQARIVAMVGEYEAFADLAEKTAMDYRDEMSTMDADDKEALKPGLADLYAEWAMTAAMLVPDKEKALKEARLRWKQAFDTHRRALEAAGLSDKRKPVWAP